MEHLTIPSQVKVSGLSGKEFLLVEKEDSVEEQRTQKQDENELDHDSKRRELFVRLFFGLVLMEETLFVINEFLVELVYFLSHATDLALVVGFDLFLISDPPTDVKPLGFPVLVVVLLELLQSFLETGGLLKHLCVLLDQLSYFPTPQDCVVEQENDGVLVYSLIDPFMFLALGTEEAQLVLLGDLRDELK